MLQGGNDVAEPHTVKKRNIGGRYHGQKAARYNERRLKQKKWHKENELVAEYFDAPKNARVLDCPVGTGRFIPLYRDRKVLVYGGDVAQPMLDEARKELRKGERWCDLWIMDAANIDHPDKHFDTVVCFRLFHLVRQDDADRILKEICRVADRVIILTATLRSEYAEQTETACQDEKRFRRMIARLGWRVDREQCITNGGWWVMRLVRK